ncbi:MAG TPA: AAA family ATPase [Tabrizicola sp.]|jgi:adenylate kinase family enzyme|nr:AAA family ATPase [Tabrizicola sp.]
MRRVMIVGSPGAGKSTLAMVMGRALGLPVHHLERICFRKGWRWVPTPQRDAAMAQVFALPAYVLEGNYPQTFSARLADCDTLIWLDLPVLLRLWRVCRRLWRHRGQERPDLPEGSVETDARHQWAFWRYFLIDRLGVEDATATMVAKAPPGVQVIHLRSRREVGAFVAGLK